MSNVDEDRVFTHEQGENLLTRQEQIRNELAGIRNTLNKHFGVEPALMQAKGYDSFQFIRNGFFCADAKLSAEGAPVFGRIVSLKSSFRLPGTH